MKIAVLNPKLQHKKSNKPKHKQRALKYFGLHIVVNEIKRVWGYEVPYIEIEQAKHYDTILVSIHSIEDIYSIVYTIDKFHDKNLDITWVCGGAGIANIQILSHYFNYIALGRGELSIMEILRNIFFGTDINNNHIWIKRYHNLDHPLRIRYTQKLYNYEVENRKEYMYGCKYNCFYCRYRYSTLPPTKRNFDTLTSMPGNEETFWELEIKNGSFYTTSLDGLTEKIRLKVNKPITNQQVIDKLVAIPPICSHVNLKIYMISCYPNDNEVNLSELVQICKAIDKSKSKNKFMLKIYFTPFTPEPTTPMQWCPLNISFNLKNELVSQLGSKLHIYNTPKIRMQINQAINSPFTMVKRAILNRAYASDIDLIRFLVFNPKMSNHNVTHADKLIILQTKYNLRPFVSGFSIGTILASSNIASWESDSNMQKMAIKVHQAFNLNYLPLLNGSSNSETYAMEQSKNF